MRIAIVGGGVSGLVAMHLLAREHDVQLFEAAAHLGGHTRTVMVEEDGRSLPVDMGFIVYNELNYPNFSALLRELDVETGASEMSFSVRCERTGLEWNGSSLNQVFAQRSNLLRPSFYWMLREVLRFHREVPKLLAGEQQPTLGEFLEERGFRGRFVEHYLIPMTSAIWSTDRHRMFDYPARPLFNFLSNHRLVHLGGRPQWRYVCGGSTSYVEALRRPLVERIALATPIERIRRTAQGVEVKPEGEAVARFDRVLIATHSDQALRLLDDPTVTERQVLGAITYQESDVVLHTDSSFLPRRELARASWNYHLGTAGEGVQLTYFMNRLQHLETSRTFCVTLNRTADIAPRSIVERATMAHPLYTREAIAAQQRWREISGGTTLYCGAYWGSGFHEDGVVSALRAARLLSPAVSVGGRRQPLRAELRVVDDRFFSKIALEGSVGAAEAFMAGYWTSPDLTAVLRVMLRHRDLLEGLEGGWARLAAPLRWLSHTLRANTRGGSRRNIFAHYDLGNDFFDLFLDPHRMYSCAIFEYPQATLEEAALAKLDRICCKLDLQPSDHVLEIGSGWGGFAVYAAGKYGCRVTTTTISSAQHAKAREVVRAAGLEGRVKLLESDYRDLEGTYDKLVSIEMIEAVGERYLETFFRVCCERLKPEGLMVLQGITIADHLWPRYRRGVDFIQRYIFPGSQLISVSAATSAIVRTGDLQLVHLEDIGPHYALTLEAWRDRFLAHHKEAFAMGFEEAFLRMWLYYFCYCEAGFAERTIGDVQMVLARPGNRRSALLGDLV